MEDIHHCIRGGISCQPCGDSISHTRDGRQLQSHQSDHTHLPEDGEIDAYQFLYNKHKFP